MESDVHETAVAVGPDLRHAGDGSWIEHSVANDAEATRALGDQHASIGKERDRPWMREPSGHDADANLVLLRRIEYPRSRAQWWHRDTDPRLLLSVGEREHAEEQRRNETS